MKNDRFYFSHDYNSVNDEKLLRVRAEFNNAEGYGMFWMIVEKMAENDGGVDGVAIASLSLGLSIPKELLQRFIDFCVDIELFYREGTRIYSKRMVDHKSFRKSLSDAGKAGAKARHSHPTSHPIAKERKGKERKEKERVVLDHASFILSLKTNELYKHIDIDRQLVLAADWLKNHPDRKMTRKFFIGWLNRIDVPLVMVNKDKETQW